MTPVEVQRYARQILVRDIGREGQETWLRSHVVARGQGAALDAAVELLRAAGVSTIERTDAAAPPELAGRVFGTAAYVDRRAACPACVQSFLSSQPAVAEAEHSSMAFGLGALVASDVLMSLLDLTRPPLAMALAPRPHTANPARLGCACRS